MIISHKHKFIFVKTKKTAGTSIEIALSNLCGKNDILTPIADEDESQRRKNKIHPKNYKIGIHDFKIADLKELIKKGLKYKRRQLYSNHSTAKEIQKNLDPKIWNSYFKFCFERNPIDKAISAYNYHMKFSNQELSFEHFLKSNDFYKNFHRYSIDDQIAVDFVGKYETLQDDFDHILRQIGIEKKILLPKSKISNKRREPLISNESKEIIINKCKMEFKHLGYEY